MYFCRCEVEIIAKKLYLRPMRIVDEIEIKIKESEAGALFFVTDFANGGNDVFISRLLSEFAEQGVLCRLAKGVYYKPVMTKFGVLMPDVQEIVKAIARRDNAQVLPTGETAANLLGLSTQVPMNYVYLTSGSARKIMVGKKTVTFKRCVPKNFACQNEFLAVLIQAMKAIGQERLTDGHCVVIKGLLMKHLPIESLDADMRNAPLWVRRMVYNIIKEIGV